MLYQMKIPFLAACNEASGNEVISNRSLTEKDAEFVVNENSSSHQYTFTEEDIRLFQNRFENGYYLYHDNLYFDCLRQEHPDSLPDALVNDEQVHTSVTVHPSTMANNLEQEEAAEQNGDISTNTSFISQESEPSNDDANSTSLSSSLSMTRKLISELTELITPPKTSTGKSKVWGNMMVVIFILFLSVLDRLYFFPLLTSQALLQSTITALIPPDTVNYVITFRVIVNDFVFVMQRIAVICLSIAVHSDANSCTNMTMSDFGWSAS